MSVRTRMVKVAAAVTLSAAVLGVGTMLPAGATGDNGQQHRKVNEYEGQHRKVNEYEGQHRKVNEYEGQHRLTAADADGISQLLTHKVNEYEGQHR
jgi:hypothetical protein